MTSEATFEGVKMIIVRTLGIQDRIDALDSSTLLFGSMPELDSLAVVELASSIEEEFGFEIDDDDFTSEIFETLGTLAEFVERSRTQRNSLQT